ncbi:MAG: response regulator transcription factor [Gaiellaceae bacterium]
MTGAKLRVVLADDTHEYRLLLKLVLEQDGRFEIVGEAADGEQAVAVASAEQPDAVVLDLAMPVMDGLEAIPGIRSGAPGAAIVVLSGFARGRLDRKVLELGADAYVEKGEAFSKIVSTLLEASSARVVA